MKKILKKIIVLSVVFTVLISYMPVFANSVFFITKTNFMKDFKVKLSNDGKVTATYTKAKKQLFISGNGKIDQKLWILMAKKFDENNFRKSYENEEKGWVSYENFDIVFDKKTKVKLCNTIDFKESSLFVTGLFYNFDKQIYFNNAVDTSEVTDMRYMFAYAKNFNQPVNFDTKNVRNMSSMFYFAKSFNQPVNFDTSKVEWMNAMFFVARNFNQPVKFNTSKVENMVHMFSGAWSFNQPLNFDTKNVTKMAYMFSGANSFNSPINFDTRNVTEMDGMFRGAISFNQPLNFNTSKVTDMSWMFSNAINFNQPLNFDTSKVTDMSWMFSEAFSFNQPLNFNTSNVKRMIDMFRGAISFNQPLNFNTSKVTKMDGMFRGAINFNRPINFNSLNVYNIDGMFCNIDFFKSNIKLDISNLDSPKNDEDRGFRCGFKNILFGKLNVNINIPIKKLTLMNNDRLNKKVYQLLLKNSVANEYEFINLGNFTFKLPADYIVKNLTTKKQKEVKKGVSYKFEKGNNYLLINKNPTDFKNIKIKKEPVSGMI